MYKNKVRVRIAPSPTSSIGLHLGNIRTALFNYLFAMKTGGDFILRIEDSDQKRDSKSAPDTIYKSLCDLGMPPSEGFGTNNQPYGPYRQSERLETYKEKVNFLLEKGLAYKCYCSDKDIEEQRKKKESIDSKSFFKYPGTCRNIKSDLDKPFVVRFRSPTEGFTEFDDAVFGNKKFSNIENQDFIISRSDGLPLYNLGAVSDDIDHHINWVIRGKDHLVNMIPQILLYKAFGASIPKFAHLPMMLGEDGVKLAKRHCSVNINQWFDAGYTPSGILNYLARFGWGFGNQEIFSMEELVDKFSLEACGKNDAKFDPKKFAAIQFEHLKNTLLTSDDEYISKLTPFLEKKGILNSSPSAIKEVLHLIRPRAHTLIEAADEITPFLVDEIGSSEAFKDVPPKVKEKVGSFISELSDNNSWDENNLRQLSKDWLLKNELSLKELGGFMRLALTGRSNSPELFQVMAVLGRARSLKRLEIGMGRL